MGRRRKEDTVKTRMVNFAVAQAFHTRLRVAAARAGVSMGEICRRAVAEYLGRRPRKGEKKGGA